MNTCECSPRCQYCDAELIYTQFGAGESKTCSCGKKSNYIIFDSEFQCIFYETKGVHWRKSAKLVESTSLTKHTELCQRFNPCDICKIPVDSYYHNVISQNYPGTCPRMSCEMYRRLQDLWYMHTAEYTSQLQWLPKEMLEDVMVLIDAQKRNLPIIRLSL